MKRRIYAVILLGTALCLTKPAFANRTLVFQVHSERSENEDAGKKRAEARETKEPTDYKLTVVLGRNFFSRNDGRSLTIYDFQKKRIFTVDDSKKQYEDDSLYSDLGFRVYELKNREFLGGALDKAGVKDNPMSAAFSQHLFSLEIENAGSRINEAKRGGNRIFSVGGKPLMTISTTGDLVNTEELNAFLRFFRYTFGGHPSVLRKMATLGKIPNSLAITRYNVSAEIVTLTLLSNKTGPDVPYSLTGLEETLHGLEDEALSGTILKLKKETTEQFQKQSDRTLESASKAFEKKQYLPCMLAYLEYTLETGGQFPASFEKRRQKIRNDENVKQFFAVLNPKSKEEAEKALPVYKKLRQTAGEKEHVLMIFEANVRSNLGQEDEAEELFLRVLEKNPYISGVYKDLGDIYFNRYSTSKAWQCWDLGRKLAPAFKNFKQVTEFEKTLVREHPEFF